MKKFEFRLQKLLDIREKLELDQKNKLALAASEYNKLLQKQDQTLSKASDFRAQVLSSMHEGTVNIQSLKYMDQLQSQASQYVRSLSPELEKTRLNMEKEREKYAKTHRDKKLLENFKKKELQKYKKLQTRNEMMIMDEIAKNFSHDTSQYYEP